MLSISAVFEREPLRDVLRAIPMTARSHSGPSDEARLAFAI
jgi:hypothetical protein